MGSWDGYRGNDWGHACCGRSSAWHGPCLGVPHSCDGAGRGREESGRSFTTAAADRGRVSVVSHAAAGVPCGDTLRLN